MGYDHGRFVWHELISEDTEAAKGFYGELFGWRFESMDMGEMQYLLVKCGEAAIGGLVPPPADGVSPHWVGYVSVADVDASAAALVEAGGVTLMDALDVPTVGRMQPVKDAQGAAFFLFHAADGDPEAPSGPGSFHWNELWAKDPAAAAAQYAALLGYTSRTMAMPDGDYHVLSSGEAPRAGVMAAPGGAPPRWTFYVRVEDVDATVARAKKLGGDLVGELMDVEGVGRFGFVRDREGVTIGVIAPAG